MGKKKTLAASRCRAAARRALLDLVKKKRAADKGKEKTICDTRTVEMLPSETVVGNERTKLLFMLALGLVPKNGNTNGPVVALNKLDPSAEAEARSRRKKWIGQAFQRRRLQRIRAGVAYYRLKTKQRLSSSNLRRRTSRGAPVLHIPTLSSLAANMEKEQMEVETVDLVSSDDDCKVIEDTSLLEAAGISSCEPFRACNPGIQQQHPVPKISNACKTKPVNCKRKTLSSSSSSPLERYMKPVYRHGRITDHVTALHGTHIPAILTHKRLVSKIPRASTTRAVAPEIGRDPLSSSSSCVSTSDYILPDDPVIITID